MYDMYPEWGPAHLDDDAPDGSEREGSQRPDDN